MKTTPIIELKEDICGIPNPQTNDVCTKPPKHEEINCWHEDGAGEEWLGKPGLDYPN